MDELISGPALQQTIAWQKFQTALGEQTFFEDNELFTFLAIKKSTPLGNYLYLPYGPFLKSNSADIKTQPSSTSTTKSKNTTSKNKQTSAQPNESASACLDSLLVLAKKEHAFFIRIEPQQPFFIDFLKSQKNIMRLIKSHDLNPADTWQLDLTEEKQKIISNFAQGTRTRYNNFAKKGLTVEISKNPSDIRELTKLQKEIARQKNIATFSENYLKTELEQDFASLYLVKFISPDELNSQKNDPKNLKFQRSIPKNLEIQQSSLENPGPKNIPNNNEILAASLFFDDNTTRYYMQSAASYQYRNLPATVALLTTAIFDAKEKGLKTFDFWGITPEGAKNTHPWAGFTEFKKSFGGHEVHYAGTFDLILNQKRFTLYTLLRKFNRSLSALKRRLSK